MGHSWRHGVVVVVAVLAISSCSSTSQSDASVATQPDNSVRTNPANGTPATFGASAAVGDLTVTATDPVIGTDGSGPWLTLTVRAENRTQLDIQSPQFELRCSGSSAGGTWLETSTFVPGQPVLPGSSSEGTISLVLPGDKRLGGPRPSCVTPATVVASLLTFDNVGAGPPVQKRVGWTVPDSLVDQLNAAPQPSGS